MSDGQMDAVIKHPWSLYALILLLSTAYTPAIHLISEVDGGVCWWMLPAISHA
jgi:hypothetical protein